MEEFAARLELRGTWEQLPLPDPDRKRLREIALSVKHRQALLELIGVPVERAETTTVLFVGPDGAGKTIAAAVLANELGRGLYRVALARVVSKYIGETEKNLTRLFEAAEAIDAILFFDEADSLIGKRSKLKDSHNRFANSEISDLLQHIESFSGLAVLTTNMQSSLDESFARRFYCIIEFPDSADERVQTIKKDRQKDDDT